jgi:hypothetical protein
MASLRPASMVLASLPFVLVLGCGNQSSDPPATGAGSGGNSGGASTGGKSGGSGGTSGSSTGGQSGGGAGSGGTSSGAGGTSGGTSGGSSGGSTGAGSGGTSGGGSGGSAGASGGDAGGGEAGPAPSGDKFSFFVTSLAGLQKLSKNEKGFGGDLRYGQNDGISGADKICTELAEASMPGSGAKGWRAFLSAEKGPMGTPVNAIERIGEGPWYDRKGRLLANNKAELLNPRPINADPAIKNDFPNEFGVNNSRPNPAGREEDNHHFLTGSNGQGMLLNTNTCLSWTTTMTTQPTRPKTGFSFVISNRRHWIDGQIEGGCGAGVSLGPTGPANPNIPLVSSGGGYGGFYCFALKP